MQMMRRNTGCSWIGAGRSALSALFGLLQASDTSLMHPEIAHV
ncbi:hypothetical protein [Primorskyibacter sp. S87]